MIRLKKLFLANTLLSVLISFTLINLVVASSEMWSKTYGNGTAYSLVETSDNGFAIAGRSFGAGGDFWLVKTDGNGSIQWNQSYGGNNYDMAYALVETSDGGYALVGYTESFGAGGSDFWMVKTDSNGNMEWNQTYGGPGYDYANCLIETSEGGYAIGGSFNTDHEDPFGDRDFWLVKTDSNGNMEWNQTYGGPGYDYANCLIETSEGGYLLAGNTGLYLVESNIWIIKTDEQGNIEWDERYGGREQSGANSVIKTLDGGYACAGYLSGDFWLIKIDGSGNMEWNQTYSNSGVEEAHSLVMTSDGGYALAGITSSTTINQSHVESWMVKTDTIGNEIWRQTYEGTEHQYIYSLVETTDEEFVLAGYKTSTYPNPPDLWLMKTDEYGNIPEFPSWIIYPFVISIILVVLSLKKKMTKYQ